MADTEGAPTSTTYNGTGRIVMAQADRDSAPPAPGRPWYAVELRWLIERVGMPSIIVVLLLYGGWRLVNEVGTHLVATMERAAVSMALAADRSEKNGARLDKIETAIKDLTAALTAPPPPPPPRRR